MKTTRLAALSLTTVLGLAGLTGCGSDSKGSDADQSTTTESSPAASAPSAGCPTGDAAKAAPALTIKGATGSAAIIGQTDSTQPGITVTKPFTVKETVVKTVKKGAGAVVAPTATVKVCYLGVNGRDGVKFDSAYDGGKPVEFPLDGVVKGFAKAIAGQTVGSDVLVAMTPVDGYGPQGNPQAGIQGTDTLVFAIHIVSAS